MGGSFHSQMWTFTRPGTRWCSARLRRCMEVMPRSPFGLQSCVRFDNNLIAFQCWNPFPHLSLYLYMYTICIFIWYNSYIICIFTYIYIHIICTMKTHSVHMISFANTATDSVYTGCIHRLSAPFFPGPRIPSGHRAIDVLWRRWKLLLGAGDIFGSNVGNVGKTMP